MHTPESIPEVLYKYRNLEGQNREYLRHLFTHAQIYFASPAAFSDPFDCRVHVSAVGSRAQHRAYLTKLFKKYQPHLNHDQRRAAVAKAMSEKKPHDPDSPFNVVVLRDVQEEINNLGVFCLCESPYDLCMWSYYAAGHTGLCLEFEHKVPGLGVALNVEYRTAFPVVNQFTHSSREQMEANLLTKAACWSHEAEWRIFEDTPGLRRFEPSLLSGVIFGCKMPSADRAEVESWILAGPTRPKLYEACIKESEYGLEVRPVGDSDREARTA